MVGISRRAAYVPRLRLDRKAIAQTWATAAGSGTRAIANYDEDALTMACEVVAQLSVAGPEPIDGLYFASASAPYWEKQMAAMAATACDLPRRILSADFGGSARGATAALLAAVRAVQAGGAKHVAVVGSDVRVPAPESDIEGLFGDAAAGVVVSDHRVLAEFVDAASVSEEFTYLWRTDTDRHVQAFPGKFSNTFGYARDLGEAIGVVLERNHLTPADIAKLALYSPDARAAADLAKSLKFDPKRQLTNSLFPVTGCTGNAEALLALGQALETAKPRDWILVGSFGEGADVLLFRATDAIANAQPAVPVQSWVDAGEPIGSYGKYLKYRRLIESDEPVEAIANVLEFKELKQDVRLYGSRCHDCGTVQYPVARVCTHCKGRELSDHRLSRRGTVFTFTVDHLIANLELPMVMAVVDLDGGGRVYLQMTDVAVDTVAVGMRVGLSFRRLHHGGSNYNYYWKARPLRARGEA